MTKEETKKFQYWQWRTILGTMIGYAIFYFVRKNFSFAIPGLTAEYGISKTTFGLLMTIVGQSSSTVCLLTVLTAGGI